MEVFFCKLVPALLVLPLPFLYFYQILLVILDTLDLQFPVLNSDLFSSLLDFLILLLYFLQLLVSVVLGDLFGCLVFFIPSLDLLL